MAFESGAVSFRVFYVPDGLPRDAIKRFADHAAPPIDTLTKGEINGWVTGRHLLDRVITEDTAHLAGRLRLSLMKAERKIPEALLRAECRMQELAVMQAEGKEVLKRSVRAEIKKEVTDRLLPKMPPTLTGIPVVYDDREALLYAGATTEKQMDALVHNFRHTTGTAPIPLTPESAALKRKQVNARDLSPVSFSPECEDELAGGSLGMDFLTWLWFFSEQRGGLLSENDNRFAVMLEGPLTFYMEGQGAHLTVLRNGEPLVASEAKTALLSGKKLRRATVVMTREEETWRGTVDAEDFVFRSLKLPKVDHVDAVSRFEERMLSLARFRHAFLGYFDRFLEERTGQEAWNRIRAEIHRWVSDRAVKA